MPPTAIADRSVPRDNHPESQNALAQALTGKRLFSEVDRSTTASIADGGSKACQQALDLKAKDMNDGLVAKGDLPRMDIKGISEEDRRKDFSSMMATAAKPDAGKMEISNKALDNTLMHVEDNRKIA